MSRRYGVWKDRSGEDLDWMDDGACRGHDPDLWFPERGESNDEAVAICNTCPVQQTCLEYAVANEPVGVWGGASARQRRRMHSPGVGHLEGRPVNEATYRNHRCRCTGCVAAHYDAKVDRQARQSEAG